MPEFVNLHNHFHTSILDGYGTIDESLDRIVECNQKAVGLTDHGNVFGVHDFIKKSRDRGVTPVPGVEAYFAPINPDGARAKRPIFYGKGGVKSANFDVSANGAYLHQTLWAYNNEGMKNLFKLVSQSNKKENFYQAPRMDFEMLAEHSDGLIVGTGCPSSEISTRFLLGQDKEAYEFAGRLKEIFKDKLFVEIMDHSMSINLERDLLPKQLELSKRLDIPLLATNDSHYAHPDDAIHHEEMLCTQSGARMTDKTYDEGGPRFAFEGNEYYLKTAEEMLKIFPDDQFKGAISNTLLVAEMAEDISLDFDPTLRVKAVTPEGKDEVSYLKKLIHIGLRERYGDSSIDVKQEALNRVKEEFEVLHSSDFIGYMLTVYEYLQWTKDNFSTYNEKNEVIAYPIGAGRGCFLPGNKVNTNKGLKNIEMISNTDLAKTFSADYLPISKTFRYEVDNEPCINITLKNGEGITCTADHRIYVKNKGFIEASKINKEDILLGPKIEENVRNSLQDNKKNEGYFLSDKVISKNIKYSSYYELMLLNYFETSANVLSFDNYHTGKNHNSGFKVKYIDNSTKVFIIQDKQEEGVLDDIQSHDETELVILTKDLMNDLISYKNLEFEIENIEKFNYTGFVYDLEVDRANNYTVSNVVVHNSVGGSIIAYLIGISEVDPIKHDLLFSRFLSAGRGATYEITYEDGSKEEIVVSEKKKVRTKDNKVINKYIHQLEEGDEII